jgi:serine acetyltransferase
MGVTIGKGAAVAGMCLIKKDVPPNTFVIPRPQLKMISTKSSLIIRK